MCKLDALLTINGESEEVGSSIIEIEISKSLRVGVMCVCLSKGMWIAKG